MNNEQEYRIDVRADRCNCPICHKEDGLAFLYHGRMIMEPVTFRGYRVFRMQSYPNVSTYWRFELNFHADLSHCAKAEADLVETINGASARSIKMTIIGPCKQPPTKGAYAFFFGEEIDWPPKPGRDGILVLVDPSDVHVVLTKKPQIPLPPALQIQPPVSLGLTGLGTKAEPEKPNPLPTPLFVPPGL